MKIDDDDDDDEEEEEEEEEDEEDEEEDDAEDFLDPLINNHNKSMVLSRSTVSSAKNTINKGAMTCTSTFGKLRRPFL